MADAAQESPPGRTAAAATEGVLSKYTNVMKGWQFRYFILDPDAGILEYYIMEDGQRMGKARGMLPLAGAVISPSDEDSHTFAVNAATGDIFRLRAFDARERQHWIQRLRAVAQDHTEQLQRQPAMMRTSLPQSVSAAPLVPGGAVPKAGSIESPQVVHHYRSMDQLANIKTGQKPPVTPSSLRRSSSGGGGGGKVGAPVMADPLQTVREVLARAEGQQQAVAANIAALPATGVPITCLDRDLLLLKATSHSTMLCLESCLSILQQAAAATAALGINKPAAPGGLGGRSGGRGRVNSLTGGEWLARRRVGTWSPGQRDRSASGVSAGSLGSEVSLPTTLAGYEHRHADISEADEVEDSAADDMDITEEDMASMEEHKSIILHVLGQLKLGMDLTRVTLPTFILERRSLLEMFADFLSHPQLFLRITDKETPEERMVAVFEWYITAFHAGRKGLIAKKPYNPIIGETFNCSWRVKDSEVPHKIGEVVVTDSGGNVEKVATVSDDADGESVRTGDRSRRVTFCAEQVSHHPPVTAVYAECLSKRVYLEGSTWTKSKFMGTAIGVSMIGELRLHLLDHHEMYTLTLPSAYARSILTTPWSELGGRCTISCDKSDMQASVTFQTKPFYGGKLHHVTGEVKNSITGQQFVRLSGDWNANLSFLFADGVTRVVDLTRLPTVRKKVRPLEKQADFESRRLWRHVTHALKDCELDLATQHKRDLEERQRAEEKQRLDAGISFPTKFFTQEGEMWLYTKSFAKAATAVNEQ